LHIKIGCNWYQTNHGPLTHQRRRKDKGKDKHHHKPADVNGKTRVARAARARPLRHKPLTYEPLTYKPLGTTAQPDPLRHVFVVASNMPLGPAIIKLLEKKYEPSSFVEQRFKEFDLGFRTDEEGNPVLLFLGKKSGDGTIKGQRYARRLVKDKDGKILKDHWDDKGKAT
jgi:hypothetical protein